MKNRPILAIDTSTGVCSVALTAGTVLIAESVLAERAMQAERLMSLIEEVLASGKCEMTDLAALAVSIGPGSFTGVRIGLAAAKGMALASGLPLIGISTLEAVAWHPICEEEGKIRTVILNAQRGQLYVQSFDANRKSLSEPVMVEVEDVGTVLLPEPSLLLGDGVSLALPFIDQTMHHPVTSEDSLLHARYVARAAEQLFLTMREGNNPAPLYVRPPDAKLPKERS